MTIRIAADDVEGALTAIRDAGLDVEIWAEKSWGKMIEWAPGMAAVIEADDEAKVVLGDFGIEYEVEP